MPDPLQLYEPTPVSPGLLKPFVPVVEKPGTLGVLARSFGEQVVPFAAGIAAAPVGELVGGGIGTAIGGPIGAAIGVGVGGLVTGGVAGYGAEKAQTAGLDLASDGGYSQMRSEDEAAHPIAAFVGGALPQAVFMKPGSMNAAGALLGGGIGAGVEAGTEYAQTGEIDPLKVAGQGAFGALFQHNRGIANDLQIPARRTISAAGRTAARFGANVVTARALADVPGADAHVAQAATDLQDPNLSQETRNDLARTRGLQAALGGRVTPDERAAAHVVETDAHTEATNPYVASPETAAAHVAAVDTASEQLVNGEPIAVAPPAPAFSGLDGVADRIIQIESGGNPNAKNPHSSASGLGQFTDGTWLNLYRLKNYAAARDMSDGDILALKRDPAVARQMTRALTSENRDALLREQLPVSDGNLYMLHFLGMHDGTRLLRAAGDTPIEALLPERTIAANERILRGKTASEVVAWAEHKMGGHGTPAPTLRPEFAHAGDDGPVPGFDDDSLFEMREGDPFGNEAERAGVAQEASTTAEPVPGRPGDLTPDDYLDRYATKTSVRDFIDQTDVARGMGSAIVAPDGSLHVFRTNGEVPGWTNEVGHYDFQYSVGPVHANYAEITRYRREYALTHPSDPTPAQRAILNEIKRRGRKAEANIVEEDPKQAATEAAYAEIREHQAAFDAKNKPVEPIQPSKPVRSRDPRPMSMRRKGPVDAVTFLADRGGIRDDEGHALGKYGRKVKGSGAYRSGRDLDRFVPGAGPLIRKTGMSIDRAGELLHEAGYFPGEERPDVADVLDMLERTRYEKIYTPSDQDALDRSASGVRGGTRASLERFDEPGGEGQAAQADSLEHDIAMAVDADPEWSVQLDDHGDGIRVADLLARFDDEAQGLGALRSCLVPGAA